MIDRAECKARWYSTALSPHATRAVQDASGSEHAILALELLPALLSKTIWADEVAMGNGRTWCHFIDNESARCALIKGRCSNPFANVIVAHCDGCRTRGWEATHGGSAWRPRPIQPTS